MTGAPGSGTSPWLLGRRGRRDADMHLYCFPHAGGSPGEYVRWSRDLPEFHVRGIHLPGRMSRVAEPSFTRIEPLVDALVTAVTFSKPFVFFGHSLGALVAFEAARELRRRGREQPDRLILSSCPAPPITRAGRPTHGLADESLLALIERHGGTVPEEIRADPDLLATALACFRADFEILETYRFDREEPLDIPIIVLVGADEGGISRVDGWAAHTRGPAEIRVLPGGHFHFRERPDQTLRVLRESVAGGDPAGHETSARHE